MPAGDNSGGTLQEGSKGDESDHGGEILRLTKRKKSPTNQTGRNEAKMGLYGYRAKASRAIGNLDGLVITKHVERWDFPVIE